MTSAELKDYATKNELTVPEPPYDADTKKAVRALLQAHISANMGNGGGKTRTIKRKRTPKKRTLKKRV